jgi:MFS family permease
MQGRRLSYVLVFTAFYEQLSWTPVLVLLAASLGDAEAIALAASAYSLANLGGNLAFGYLADRLGRYRVAGAGLLAMAATTLLHLRAPTPDLLVAARFLHGLAGATVASLLSPPVTGRMAGLFGPERALTVQAAVLAAVGLVTLVAGLKDSAPQGLAHWRKRLSLGPGALSRLQRGLALTAGGVAFVLMFGQNVLFYALPLKARSLAMSPGLTGGILGAFAVGAAVAFMPPLSRLSDRRGRRLPIVTGLSLVAAALLTLAAGSTAPVLTAGMLLYGFGFGLVFPAVSALSADASGRENRGLAYGLLTAAFSAGAIAGPLITRALSGVLSPFVTTAAVILAGAAATLLFHRAPAPPPAADA